MQCPPGRENGYSTGGRLRVKPEGSDSKFRRIGASPPECRACRPRNLKRFYCCGRIGMELPLRNRGKNAAKRTKRNKAFRKGRPNCVPEAVCLRDDDRFRTKPVIL